MLVALGFLAASLLGLLAASAFWSRAVRLTTARIKQSMPVSEPEIKADRDRLRAEYAIKVHKLEMQLGQARLERARQLIEINRRDASISTQETDMVQLKTDLEEHQNARRVLEQTIADRLPRVEARLAEARRLLFNRDREIAELSAGAKRHKQALDDASSAHAQQAAQIERMSTALTTRGGRKAAASGDGHLQGEVALRSEIEALRARSREQATLIDRLQLRLGHGYVLPAPAKAASVAPTEDDMDRVRQDLSEAEAALSSARVATPEVDAGRAAFEQEIRALKSRAEDQAGEIARLKAALTTFEQRDGKVTGFSNSKIALKARLGSAQAQAEQQAATIAKLRGELAATHERLARQAAHFMDEMKRIGGGAAANGQNRRPARGPDRRSLAERVAQVHALAPPERTVTAPPRTESSQAAQAATSPSNGHKGKASASGAAGAESPKGPEIPAQRRRVRLLDRITGHGKSG